MNRIDWLCGFASEYLDAILPNQEMVGHLTDELHVDVDMLIISSILCEWSLANCCEAGRQRSTGSVEGEFAASEQLGPAAESRWACACAWRRVALRACPVCCFADG